MHVDPNANKKLQRLTLQRRDKAPKQNKVLRKPNNELVYRENETNIFHKPRHKQQYYRIHKSKKEYIAKTMLTPSKLYHIK